MRTRSGTALVLAVLGIVCLGVLLAGMAFVTREDHVLSTAARDSQRAFTTAERALWTAVATLDSSALRQSQSETSRIHVSAGAADTASGTVTRLGPALFLLSGEGGVRARDSGYQKRRVGLLVRAVFDSGRTVTFVPLPQRSWVEFR